MKTENLEINKYKLTFEVDATRFEEGMNHSYNKNKSRINMEGFRKGKVPRKLIEAQYGKEMLFEDAINFVLPQAYDIAKKESGLEIVSRPEIDAQSVSTEEGVVFTALVYTKPEVKIEDFKNILYKPLKIEVTEEEVNNELMTVTEKNSRVIEVTDRAIEMFDIVTLDFDGSVDGVKFDGGKGEDFELEIGSKTFIDTFEEQLVGSKIGDECVVKVTFPKEYHAEDLKGKAAEFKVKINGVKMKETPKLDDEFARDVSEFDTLEEYKNSIIEKIKEVKQNQAPIDKENQVIDALINRATMEVPKIMIENQVNQLVEDFSNKIRQQGMSMDMYLQYMGQTIDTMKDAYRENAEVQVKGRLALECVAQKENIQVTKDEVTEEIKRMSEQYNMPIEMLQSSMTEDDKKALEVDLKVKKAVELVLSHAKEEN
jgi:trigger factor